MEPQAHDKDRRMLHGLGYAQELSRRMSGFSNFAISFTIISILSGTLTLYYQGLNYGGFVEEAYGWPIVSFFVIIVGLGMAEIASKYPTAGGLYYWSSKMGGPGWGWFTGWFNLIGQIAITAGIIYGSALFADSLLQLLWPGTFTGTSHEVIYVYAVILVVLLLVNVFSVRLVAFLNDVSVWWHVARRGDHRRVPDLQARPPPVVRDGLHEDDQQQRLLARVALVRAAARVTAGAVHVHGLRRVCAHERGDGQRLPFGGARRDHVDRRLGDLRVHPRARRDVRDPEHRRHHRSGDVRREGDLPAIARRHDGEGDALHHRRRTALLRDVVDHVGVADEYAFSRDRATSRVTSSGASSTASACRTSPPRRSWCLPSSAPSRRTSAPTAPSRMRR